MPDEPKLNVTVAPGFAVLKSVPILPNASVSDAAAETVIGPVAFGVVDVVVDDDFAAPDELDELPQAASDDTRDEHERERSGTTCGHGASLGRGQSDRRHLDDDVGGLDRRDGEIADLEPELVGALAGHERHDPVRPGLDLDDGGRACRA